MAQHGRESCAVRPQARPARPQRATQEIHRVMDHAPIPAEPPALPATASVAAEPSAQDLAHLDTIGILYYVLAGITALFALFPVIHLIAGIGILMLPAQPGQPAHDAALVGWLFVGVAVSLIGFGMILTALFVMVARRLRQRRGYMFCVVASAVSCLSMPFGTALGVFALVVLTKAPIKAVFESAPAGAK
ncbi:hypothetical protein [Lysobacter capsici]|uniref:hypothetical protein n=2 Tax=Lysobacter capsici TaxID=435897 RepID=UPI00287BB67C|nr:hypothetical protein [Lysobacter capsici]WND81929.1 hypothetical protein RJ610_06065 [Lysobacter capsici]WND87125.1 hypothetical protein RJ609_06070 [Lysobacter capsici]